VSLRRRFFLYLAAAHLFFAAIAVRTYWANKALLFVVEVLFVLSFLVGIALVRSLFGTLDLVRSGSQFLRESDFGIRFRETGQAEMDQLVAVYNRMVEHLREERIRLEEQHHFMDRILTASPSGVLTLDLDGRIATVNPAAERLLRESRESLVGRRLEEAPGPHARRLASLTSGASQVIALGGGRRAKCQRSEFMDRGFARPFFLMEELTEELRRSEKAAYEKLIRMMSHEVNNSVGAATSLLDSCLHYKDQIRPEDREDYERALGVVIGRTRELNAFMQGFSDVVRLPAPHPREADVRGLVEDVGALFRAELERRRIVWRFSASGSGPLMIKLDRGQVEQALVNIVKNAMEAVGQDGEITVTLTPGQGGARTRLVVEDTGGPLTAEVQAQLFTPFYTTRPNGQGIGLTIVQEILDRHGFEFSLEGGPDRRTQFTILF
jgi:nitrogen fixation/metabolism regulation signal transduction histidine kinase